MLRYALAALAVCLALVGAVACGDDDSEGQTTAPSQTAAASQEVCSSVADVQQAAGTLGALDPANTTLTQLQTAVTDLQSAASGLASAASAASSADQEALSSAVRRAQVGRAVGRAGPRRGRIASAGPCRCGRRRGPGRAGRGRPRPDCPGGAGTTTG